MNEHYELIESLKDSLDYLIESVMRVYELKEAGAMYLISRALDSNVVSNELYEEIDWLLEQGRK